MFARGWVEEPLRFWTESDWVGGVPSRRSCSGGCVQRSARTLCHRSKTQAKVALSSGEAELNSAVKGISEVIRAMHVLLELFAEYRSMVLSVGANTYKGMLLQVCAGKVKTLQHQTALGLGGIQSCGVAAST